MTKRIPILMLLVLLAGMIMGWATTGWAQENEGKKEQSLAQVWISGGGSFLGVYPEEVTSEDVQRLGLAEERGALLGSIVADSPAAQAGLQKDDVIVRWNGASVESAAQLRRLISEMPAGRTVRLGVIRNGAEMTVSATLGKSSDFHRAFDFGTFKFDLDDKAREAYDQALGAVKEHRFGDVLVWSHRGRLGVTLQSLTPQLSEYFGLTGRSGALITSVREESPAAKAGLKAGDVILSIGGETVDDPGDAQRLTSRKEGETVEIRVLRDRREMSFSVTLEKLDRSQLIVPGVRVDRGVFNFAPMPEPFVAPRIEIPRAPTMLRPTPRFRVPTSRGLRLKPVKSGVI